LGPAVWGFTVAAAVTATLCAGTSPLSASADEAGVCSVPVRALDGQEMVADGGTPYGVTTNVSAPGSGAQRIQPQGTPDEESGSHPGVASPSPAGRDVIHMDGDGKRCVRTPMTAVRPVLEAIWQVETRQGEDRRRGDGGRAAGPIQQHREHWVRGCKSLGVRWSWPGAAPAGGHNPAGVERAFRVALANWMLDADSLVEEACRTGLNARLVSGLASAYRLPGDRYRRDNSDYARRVVAAWKEAAAG
jgi:hypothetical protein